MYKIFITLFFIFFVFSSADAAVVELNSTSQAGVGSPVYVDVLIDSDSRPINSVEVIVDYPEENLSYSGYQDGVVRFWIESPKADQGKVKFVGGIPGGVDRSYGEGSDEIKIVTLVFTPKKVGSANFVIEKSTVLLNDGKGSALTHEKIGTSIEINDKGVTQTTDESPPVEFTISYVPPNRESNTPAFITFSTYDRDSAIRGYYVKKFFVWREASSPYQVREGFISKNLKVKAVDIYGNETKEKVKIPGILPWPVLIVLILLALAGIYRHFVVKKKI